MKNKNQGFSLIEMGVVLVIIGSILSFSIGYLNDNLQRAEIKKTNYAIDKIEKAIVNYTNAQGHLPCPAITDANITSADYGVSTDCNGVSTGTTETSSGSHTIRVGVVPTRTLGLKDEDMLDAWGNRISYAVITELAYDDSSFENFTTNSNDGVIVVNDASGNQITQVSSSTCDGSTNTDKCPVVAYVLNSHGRDERAAYNRDGDNDYEVCGSTKKDSENCDNDEIFISAQLNDGEVPTKYYDDIIRWKLKPQIKLYARTNVVEPIIGFETTWETTSSSETIYLPLYSSGSYNFEIDWGDGSNETITSWSDRDHTYATAGTYTVTISGTLTHWSFADVSTSKTKIKSVEKWGDLAGLTKINFYEASNLVINATDAPASSVTDMSQMFQKAYVANPDTSTWDVSNVTNMQSMFSEASVAVPDTSGWNTSSVTNMSLMFYYASLADPDTSGWDTSNVTSVHQMFRSASVANPDTSGWDTSKFTNTNYMFYAASNADPDVSGWDVSSVTSMVWMFCSSGANPNVTSWNVINVTNMDGLFYANPNANPNVSSWNTSKVTNMDRMFRSASSANPNVTSWDVSKVTTMSEMYYFTSFDPDLSSWDIKTGADLSLFNTTSGFSTTNYNAALIAFDADGATGVTFDAGTTKYSGASATTARSNLVGKGWTITDGGAL